jgi:hypothetical protein
MRPSRLTRQHQKPARRLFFAHNRTLHRAPPRQRTKKSHGMTLYENAEIPQCEGVAGNVSRYFKTVR